MARVKRFKVWHPSTETDKENEAHFAIEGPFETASYIECERLAKAIEKTLNVMLKTFEEESES